MVELLSAFKEKKLFLHLINTKILVANVINVKGNHFGLGTQGIGALARGRGNARPKDANPARGLDQSELDGKPKEAFELSKQILTLDKSAGQRTKLLAKSRVIFVGKKGKVAVKVVNDVGFGRIG